MLAAASFIIIAGGIGYALTLDGDDSTPRTRSSASARASPSASPSHAPWSWSPYASRREGFMVLAPGTATKTWKGRQPLWWGAAYHRIDFDSMPVGIRGDKHTFTILYADAPRYIVATYGTPPRFLRVMRDATAEPFPASTIPHDRAIHLGRSPGRAFTIALDDHGGVIDARIFLVGDRFYELAVGSTPYLCLVDRASSRRFLRSFRLLRPEDYV